MSHPSPRGASGPEVETMKDPEAISEQDLMAFVQLLAEQLAEVQDRLSRLEARMNAAQPEAPSPVMSYGEFLTAAREACRKIDQKGRTFGLIPIPDLRQTLGERLSRTAFDQYVLQLQRDRLVYAARPPVLAARGAPPRLRRAFDGRLDVFPAMARERHRGNRRDAEVAVESLPGRRLAQTLRARHRVQGQSARRR